MAKKERSKVEVSRDKVAMSIPDKLAYAVAAIATIGLSVAGGYYMGLSQCQSFFQRIKDFFF